MKLLSFTVAFAVMVVLFGRAIDHELARAGANQGHNSVSVMSAARADSALSERGSVCLLPASGISSPSHVRAPCSESVPPPVQLEQPGYRWQGLTAREWAYRAVKNRRELNQADKDRDKRGRTIRRLKAELRHRWKDTSLEAIAYASVAYGVSYTTLKRKAYCETGGTFSPYAKNRTSTASGLFQFLTSTWATTPYTSQSIWDPYANALAAAWMHDVGRGGEWACR